MFLLYILEITAALAPSILSDLYCNDARSKALAIYYLTLPVGR